MPLAIKKEWLTFAREMAKHSDKIKAYRKAYPHITDNKTATTNAIRLLKSAVIKAEIKKLTDKVENRVSEKLAEAEVGEILTRARKLELLRMIAEGKTKIPTTRTTWNKIRQKWETLEVMELPSDLARIKAIEIDNKMNGHDVPEADKGRKKAALILLDADTLTEDQIEEYLSNGRRKS